ncbi:MAG: ABC transporter permease [Acidobacteriaceae bacterium]|nr:ABC transporter permease [Acidobacteriaceae bacterium]
MRRLRAAPAFTLTSVLTLAVCVGANLTIFAVIDAILIRPLPFPEARQLVTIFNSYPKAAVERDGSSITNYYERRGAIPAFRSLSIYRLGRAIVGASGSTVREPIAAVSPDFFTTLGRGPAIGRVFADSEMTYQNDSVVVLTDEYWRRHFNADPHVIGRKVWIDTFPKTVIGVLPPEFRFLSSKAQLFLPLSSRPDERTPAGRHSGGNVIQMIARLKPGVAIEQAQAQIDAQNTVLERDDPKAKMIADAGFRSLVVSLHDDQVAAIRPVLISLQAGVLALLTIGIVNLVNLLLIRASSRLRELAVRQALGAGRVRVIASAVVETTLLGIVGGLLALVMGAGGIRLVAVLGADRLPLWDYIRFDWRSAVLAFAASIVVGIALAAPIVWFSLRPDPVIALHSGSRTATGSRAAQALRHCFVVAQIALGLVLLAGTGLLGVSLKRAMAVSPGFQPEAAVAGQIVLIGNRYPSATAGLSFGDRLERELRREPGVSAVGIATNIPFSGNNGKSAATVDGHIVRPGAAPRGYYSYAISGDYFRAMGFSLKAGRFLNAEDSRRGQRTCVVDEDFARYNWPGTSPLGRRLFQGADRGNDAEAFTVVGVVGSIKQAGLTDDTAQGAVYYPYIYRPDSNIFVVVRGNLRAQVLKSYMQSVLREVDPELAVNDLQSMNDRITASLAGRRSPALLSGIFSGIALLLIAIGTYGVVSYAVAQRRREIAVRLAVGARPGQIRRQFFALTLRLLILGGVFGLPGAWITGRIMQALLFHVSANSLGILGAASAVIAVLSFGACFLPVFRAARVLPMQALAAE